MISVLPPTPTRFNLSYSAFSKRILTAGSPTLFFLLPSHWFPFHQFLFHHLPWNISYVDQILASRFCGSVDVHIPPMESSLVIAVGFFMLPVPIAWSLSLVHSQIPRSFPWPRFLVYCRDAPTYYSQFFSQLSLPAFCDTWSLLFPNWIQ